MGMLGIMIEIMIFSIMIIMIDTLSFTRDIGKRRKGRGGVG